MISIVRLGLGPLIGYAIGTTQIIALDWIRARRAHTRGLRLLRADLRRVGGFTAKFNIRMDQPPTSDDLPRPASLSPGFLSTVAGLDFWITDEHRDDNTQESLLGIADGITALADIHARAVKELEALRREQDPESKRNLLETFVGYATEYDKESDYIQFLVRDALRDIERRLKLVRWWRQLPRVVRPMPRGSNPPPLRRGDPRIDAGAPEQQ